MKRFNLNGNNSIISPTFLIISGRYLWRRLAINKRFCIRVVFIFIVLFALLSILKTRLFFQRSIHMNRIRMRSVASRTGLKAEGNQFTLDDKPFTILSGAIHYFRVVPEYWEDRLRKLKAIGLNTVET